MAIAAVAVAALAFVLSAISTFLVEWKWKLQKLYRNQCYRSSRRRRRKLDRNKWPPCRKDNQPTEIEQTNNKGQLFDGCTCNSQCNCNSKRNHKLWQVQDAAGRRCTTFQVSNETSSTSATSFRICCGSQLSVLCSEPLFGAHHFLRSFASQTSNLAN